MLDPTRYALNAETVGFRKRTLQNVDWGAFNEALQTQTESIKVRRELEETPTNEIHVMGGQRFGVEGNAKTNEIARQHRQMNGYVLRSFLATGGPVILPPKKNDSLLGIPTRFGQTQYTPNAVLGQQYTSAFTEPLLAPLDNNTILLGRAGVEALSNSISNPYKALQFRMGMDATQEELRSIESQHQQLKSELSQDLERQKLKGYQSVPERYRSTHEAKKYIEATTKKTATPNTAQIREDRKAAARSNFKQPKLPGSDIENVEQNVEELSEQNEAAAYTPAAHAILFSEHQETQQLLDENPQFLRDVQHVQNLTGQDLETTAYFVRQYGPEKAMDELTAFTAAQRFDGVKFNMAVDLSREENLLFRVENRQDDQNATSALNLQSGTENAVVQVAGFTNKATPVAPNQVSTTSKRTKGKMVFKDGGVNSNPSTYTKAVQSLLSSDAPVDFSRDPVTPTPGYQLPIITSAEGKGRKTTSYDFQRGQEQRIAAASIQSEKSPTSRGSLALVQKQSKKITESFRPTTRSQNI